MNIKQFVDYLKTFSKPNNMAITLQDNILYLNGKKVVKYFHKDKEIEIKFVNKLIQNNNSLIVNETQIHKVLFEDDTTHIFDKVFNDGNIVLQDISGSTVTINR